MSNKTVDNRFLNPVCKRCRAEHLAKYKDFVTEDGAVYDAFSVPCQGIPLDYLTEREKAFVPEEEQDEMRALWDPVTWAEMYCKLPNGEPWVARWYQAEILRCTSRRRVTRLGRRSGKSDALAIYATHFVFTNKNKKVLIVAPYKAQTQEIIDRVRAFLHSNPVLASSIAKDISSPYYNIKFHNGSEIRGFASGTKSGSEAGQVRGQDSDLILVDEIDMLTDGDLNAITPILNTSPNVKFWASGTPLGRRAQFWRWCTQSPTYKEFYHSSRVLPFWDEIEHLVRADYIGRQDAWVHEIEALFGEETVGVFQHQYTDAALRDYLYEQLRSQPKHTYSMGIDWNSEHGTEIFVTSYSSKGGFKAVDAINVPKQEWTQLAGLEAVVEMNAKWKPEFVYTDDPGGGTTHVELLRKYGHDMMYKDKDDPGVKLKDIVHLYDYGSKIEVRDPMSGKKVKKKAKPFLVENAARFLEEGKLVISKHDTVLRKQLENYIIKSRSVHGNIIYGPRDERTGDHRLDAFMLSLIGFKLQMSDFGKHNYSSHISISPGFARHTSDGQFDKEKEQQMRLERIPESRFEEDKSTIFGTEDGIPGKTMAGRNTMSVLYGWDTDDEAKYAARFRREKLLKRGKTRKYRPVRTNI